MAVSTGTSLAPKEVYAERVASGFQFSSSIDDLFKTPTLSNREITKISELYDAVKKETVVFYSQAIENKDATKSLILGLSRAENREARDELLAVAKTLEVNPEIIKKFAEVLDNNQKVSSVGDINTNGSLEFLTQFAEKLNNSNSKDSVINATEVGMKVDKNFRTQVISGINQLFTTVLEVSKSIEQQAGKEVLMKVEPSKEKLGVDQLTEIARGLLGKEFNGLPEDIIDRVAIALVKNRVDIAAEVLKAYYTGEADRLKAEIAKLEKLSALSVSNNLPFEEIFEDSRKVAEAKKEMDKVQNKLKELG